MTAAEYAAQIRASRADRIRRACGGMMQHARKIQDLCATASAVARLDPDMGERKLQEAMTEAEELGIVVGEVEL